jgi:hypothetical protein
VLIVFSLHRESLKLILVDEPLPEVVLSHLPRVVVDSNIIILDKLQPSSLLEIQVRLCEDVLQTPMIRV